MIAVCFVDFNLDCNVVGGRARVRGHSILRVRRLRQFILTTQSICSDRGLGSVHAQS